MRAWIGALCGVVGLALGGAALMAAGPALTAEGSGSSFVHDGKAGFVVTSFDVAVSPLDAAQTGACPAGMTRSYRDIFAASPQGQPHDGESALDHTRRVQQGARQLALLPDGQMACMHPEVRPPDPYERLVSGRDVSVEGIDLDGQASRARSRAAAGTCAHDDFRGLDGARDVDNQLFRVVGCMKHYQPSENSNGITLEMLQGSWGLLVTVSGVDDIRNDNDVTVGLYSNADPIQIGSNREPLSNVSYATVQDPHFRAVAHGRIVDGVLTSDPVDFQFRFVIANLRLVRTLRRARVHLTIGRDGTLEGVLAGYTPVEDAYDQDFGYRTAVDANGALTPYRLQVARGAPDTVGYTCEGVYRALYAAADGDRDPRTGRCGSISTQYRIKAVPAFVVEAQTQSANSDLERTSHEVAAQSGGGR